LGKAGKNRKERERYVDLGKNDRGELWNGTIEGAEGHWEAGKKYKTSKGDQHKFLEGDDGLNRGRSGLREWQVLSRPI